MPWTRGERIPTNLIVGFLGAGKTTAIAKLLQQRPEGENWSVFINEFGKVSIDHALVDTCTKGVAVEELAGGCVCCTMSFAFQPLLAKFIRRSRPDRLILEPSGVSHPAKVVDILRSPNFSGAIDLRNIICLVDAKDMDDPRWQTSNVFQDQVQLADIVVINWTDSRNRELIDRCRTWVESFDPPKQLILETSFGVIDPQLLDESFETVRLPLFASAHSVPDLAPHELAVVSNDQQRVLPIKDGGVDRPRANDSQASPEPRNPLRFENNGSENNGSENNRSEDDGPVFHACGWIFHLDDVFDRNKLRDFLSDVQPNVRLKGVFRCSGDWWKINRAKDEMEFSTSTYRRDSRLEIIAEGDPWDWETFEIELLQCLSD